MDKRFTYYSHNCPFVMNWGFLENWKSTAPLS